ITPVIEEDEGVESDGSGTDVLKQKYSPGLSMKDVQAIQNVIPTVQNVSPEVSKDVRIIRKGKSFGATLIGVTPVYFDLFMLDVSEGEIFSNIQNETGLNVCIIGEEINAKLFSKENAIGNYIKCGKVWLKVIGVLEKRQSAAMSDDALRLNNSNECVYIPTKTMLLRFVNRSLITSKNFPDAGFSFFSDSDEEEKPRVKNYNQLDKIIVQVDETEHLQATSELISRMLLRRHLDVEDFEITVPELLLKQQQNTKDIFNIVLVAIASISLLVGGIGIMNIMLASVMERIKEIGTRLAIGATKKDIIVQFLAESTIISLSGGIIGVILGILLSYMISHFQGILTIITFSSVFVSFIISVAVGIIFGFVPAKRAAERDPVESLRYE
ncbi:MAG: hypothetical protein C0594_12620, partial [Marinilabiliales bacterium]